MPCLNEAETLEVCIRKARGFLESNGIAGEVLIADNGSTDGSQEIAERAGARVVPVAEKGYGAALLGGIAGARGRYIIMGDADDSYDFTNLLPFVEKLRDDYDLVMGNRFRGGIAPGAMPPLHRYLGNPVLTTIGRILFPSPCGDFHCGLRGFSKTAAKRMDLRTTGMEFASEMVVKATLFGMRIAEVPTTLAPDGRSRPPHLRSWRDGWRHLRFLLMYSPRWLFLLPGIALMLGGLVLGLALLPGPLRLGAVTLDVHTLLYAAIAVALGYQSITFALFTKVFAITEGLLPEDERLNRVFKYVTLETGLIAGVGILLIGIGGSLWAFISWSQARFGPQEPRDLLRIVIPSVFAVLLGSQTILSSFFLSVLGLRRKQ
ncbi:MAG: glycosyltransferase family 2 protein [Fibrella sp.]|nr:glycosyltransferase family 2 protein [Armatimonadota bacterium]